LAQLRDAIDKHFSDDGLYPESLDALVIKKYLRKIPVDPMTDKVDSWIIVEPNKKELGKVFDVKSGAGGHGMDGSDYATW
jgi:general secretion pathway protein G